MNGRLLYDKVHHSYQDRHTLRRARRESIQFEVLRLLHRPRSTRDIQHRDCRGHVLVPRRQGVHKVPRTLEIDHPRVTVRAKIELLDDPRVLETHLDDAIFRHIGHERRLCGIRDGSPARRFLAVDALRALDGSLALVVDGEDCRAERRVGDKYGRRTSWDEGRAEKHSCAVGRAAHVRCRESGLLASLALDLEDGEEARLVVRWVAFDGRVEHHAVLREESLRDGVEGPDGGRRLTKIESAETIHFADSTVRK